MYLQATMHGPHYAKIGQDITFDLSEVALPPNIHPDDIKITWYKNLELVPQESFETMWTLNMWDVGYPAEGEYYALLEVISTGEVARTNIIPLEIGPDWKIPIIEYETRKIIEVPIGATVNFAPRCIVLPTWIHKNCIWTRHGVQLGEDEQLSITIEDESYYGIYTLSTTAYSHGGYSELHSSIDVEIVKPRVPDIVCRDIYAHDLNQIESMSHLGGGRDCAYMWIGWWVYDEIVEALIEGFEWHIDPFNSRFKYKCELAKLAEVIAKYPGIEVQESRHGYILNKRDLIW